MVLAEIRPGAYYDSVVLMQLQRALAALPGVEEAGAVMGTEANKDVLAQSELITPAVRSAKADDLLIVVRATTDAAAQAAIGQIDTLLQRRSSGSDTPNGYRPKSLESATQLLPEAQWVLVSTPGRYAAGVAKEALRLGKHVFLYSDNVTVEDEVTLKQTAAAKGLLVMGPDCGTAIVNGIGLGFANRVRRGSIGVVGASGTGLQQVTARVHQLGGGITHALGTGGRDLSEKVGAITAKQALDLLARDPATKVIVLISKPPAASVVDDLLRVAGGIGKPVVIDFIGYRPAETQRDNVYFVKTLDEAAALAVELAAFEASTTPSDATRNTQHVTRNTGKYLRGLFSGGTLAYEAQLLLQEYLPAVYANAPLDKRFKLEKATVSQGHTIVDLGEDEFTVGRLHPMLDHELRIKRLHQEAADPETAVILLDVVLGDGAHADPAGELAPAIAEAIKQADDAGRHLDVIAVVVGTDADPQNLEGQVERLTAAGAQVEFNNETAVRRAGEIVRALLPAGGKLVELTVLQQPLAAINVGLESFTASLTEQGAPVIQVDWRPPAGGNERLAGILARMKNVSGKGD